MKDGIKYESGFGASVADVKRGHLVVEQHKTEKYDTEDTTSEQVGDPMAFNPGACGRPKGWAR